MVEGEKHGSFISGLMYGFLTAMAVFMLCIPGLDVRDFWTMVSKGSEVRCNPKPQANQALCVIFK